MYKKKPYKVSRRAIIPSRQKVKFFKCNIVKEGNQATDWKLFCRNIPDLGICVKAASGSLVWIWLLIVYHRIYVQWG